MPVLSFSFGWNQFNKKVQMTYITRVCLKNFSSFFIWKYVRTK